ncbi:MAG: ORF6N domain-containing protein [Candidatus Zixiibacteriota bacterium]
MKDKKIQPVTIAVENRIYLIRGQRVMLDSDLAELYGVTTKRLNEQVKRNTERFPADFMFRLNPAEVEVLRSQFATSNKGRGGRRHLPYAFTEHGAVMLASVLNSDRAIEASIFVVRAFIRMRELLSVHKDFARKLTELERRVSGHDEDIKALVAAIRQLMQPTDPPKRKIGFEPRER